MDPSDELERAQRLRAQANRNRIDFIHAELQIALTFLDLAETTREPETRERNRANAQKAREQVEHRLREVTDIDGDELRNLQAVLGELKRRLRAP